MKVQQNTTKKDYCLLNYFVNRKANEEKFFSFELMYKKLKNLINQNIGDDNTYTISLISPSNHKMNFVFHRSFILEVNNGIQKFKEAMIEYMSDVLNSNEYQYKKNYWFPEDEISSLKPEKKEKTRHGNCHTLRYRDIHGMEKEIALLDFNALCNVVYEIAKEGKYYFGESLRFFIGEFEFEMNSDKDSGMDECFQFNFKNISSTNSVKDLIIESFKKRAIDGSPIAVDKLKYWFGIEPNIFQNQENKDEHERNIECNEYSILGFKSSYLYQQWIKRLVDEGNYHKILAYDDWVKAVNDLF